MFKLVCTLLFTLVCSQQLYAQKFIERYFDENWKEVVSADNARFYSICRPTDSGWRTMDFYVSINKIQMLGLYKDKENQVRNGTFQWFYPNGRIKEVGKYINNNKEGAWLKYYSDGSLEDSSVYKENNRTGVSLSWYRNGLMKDSANINANGRGVYVAWFDNGQPSASGMYTGFNSQHGRCLYYHKNGKISAVELYNTGVLQNKQYFNEEGSPVDTAFHDCPATFKGGAKAWNKYVSSQLYFPSHLEFKTGTYATIVITGIINEDGEIIEAEVAVPFHPEFDKIVLKCVKGSPVWEPAMNHNRKIYDTFRQSVTFSQSGGYRDF